MQNIPKTKSRVKRKSDDLSTPHALATESRDAPCVLCAEHQRRIIQWVGDGVGICDRCAQHRKV